MSPNLATIIQAGKRASSPSKLWVTNPANSPATLAFLAKASKNSYFGNNLGSTAYNKKGA